MPALPFVRSRLVLRLVSLLALNHKLFARPPVILNRQITFVADGEERVRIVSSGVRGNDTVLSAFCQYQAPRNEESK